MAACVILGLGVALSTLGSAADAQPPGQEPSGQASPQMTRVAPSEKDEQVASPASDDQPQTVRPAPGLRRGPFVAPEWVVALAGAALAVGAVLALYASLRMGKNQR